MASKIPMKERVHEVGGRGNGDRNIEHPASESAS
jgi:hypothetical protein